MGELRLYDANGRQKVVIDIPTHNHENNSNGGQLNASNVFSGGTVGTTYGGLGTNLATATGMVQLNAGTTSIVKHKWNATAAPSVSDDASAGYAVGSDWIDVTNKRSYRLFDSTNGAAVWKETTLPNSATHTDVTILDNSNGSVLLVDNVANALEAEIRMRRARSGPANLSNADGIGKLKWQGRFNGGYGDLAEVEGIYTGNGTTQRGELSFKTGSGGSPSERVRLTHDGRMGIGGTPDAAALLDLQSTAAGFKPPQMTTSQRNAISSPPEGLMIYNTDTNQLEAYQSPGASADNAWGALNRQQLFGQTANVTIQNTTSETSMLNSVATIRAGQVVKDGDSVRIKIMGYLSTFSTPGNVTLKLKINGTANGASNATALTANLSNRVVMIDFVISFKSPGNLCIPWSQGFAIINNAATTALMIGIPTTAPGFISSLSDITIDATWQFSFANAANVFVVTSSYVDFVQTLN
jgi:hypothetical protein